MPHDLPTDLRPLLTATIDAARAAGAQLRDALRAPTAEALAAAEATLRDALNRALADALPGSDPAPAASPLAPAWLLCADDAPDAFAHGHRGCALSIALTTDNATILAVVFAYAAPDDAGDLIAWARGCGPIQRDGQPTVRAWPQTNTLQPAHLILTHPAAEDAPTTWAVALAPAIWRVVPSFAYRAALVAVGDADLTFALPTSPAPPAALAAAQALISAAGGALTSPAATATDPATPAPTWCGAPALLKHKLPSLPDAPAPELLVEGDARPRAPSPAALVSTASAPHLLPRAQGCLLGLLAGDSLGAITKGLTPAQAGREHPDGGPRHLVAAADLLPGQPSAAAEAALTLARALADADAFNEEAVATAYARWYATDPIDADTPTSRALYPTLDALDDPDQSPYRVALAAASPDATSNGALARVAPLGIWGHDLSPNRLIAYARADAEITHPADVCQDASALFTATIAFAVRSGASPREVFAFADTTARSLHLDVRRAVSHAVRGPIQPREGRAAASATLSLHNAFYQLLTAPNAASGILDTVRRGGDADTNAAIAGALLGAVHGLRSLPLQWRARVLCCRPTDALPTTERPRPRAFWPTDALLLAEALLS
jgi:ADP-ribosylglycohydrolase